MVTKKKCKTGFSCGRTCIQRTRTCKSNLDAGGKKVIENYAQFTERIASESKSSQPTGDLKKEEVKKPEPKKEEGKKSLPLAKTVEEMRDNTNYTMLGEGGFGAVGAINDQPGRVLKLAHEGNVLDEKEVTMLQKANEAGIAAPKVHEVIRDQNGNISGVVMDQIFGDVLEDVDPDVLDQPESANKLLDVIEKTHRAKLLHNDEHTENILFNKDSGDFSLIDWGLTQEGASNVMFGLYQGNSNLVDTLGGWFPKTLGSAWNPKENRQIILEELGKAGFDFDAKSLHEAIMDDNRASQLNADPKFNEAFDTILDRVYSGVRAKIK